MKLHTKYLFYKIIGLIEVDLICDIGSRDAEESIRFRRILPEANIIAFEANPANFAAMKKDQRIHDCRIKIFPHVVSNKNNNSKFYIYEDSSRGLSSLFERHSIIPKQILEVVTYRLDDFILDSGIDFNTIALWIDTEGADFEVIEGAHNIINNVAVIHIEVYTEQLLKGNKTYKDIKNLLISKGFKELGISFNVRKQKEGNSVFLNKRFKSIFSQKIFYLQLKAFLLFMADCLLSKCVRPMLTEQCYQKIKKFCIRHIIWK